MEPRDYFYFMLGATATVIVLVVADQITGILGFLLILAIFSMAFIVGEYAARANQ